MDLRKIKKLIDLLEESNLAELEIKEGEEVVRLSRVPKGGVAVSAPAAVVPGRAQAVAGSPDHSGLFGLPCIQPAYPDAVGLVAAVADWSRPPAALVPLYLRRPDAKTLAERTAR